MYPSEYKAHSSISLQFVLLLNGASVVSVTDAGVAAAMRSSSAFQVRGDEIMLEGLYAVYFYYCGNSAHGKGLRCRKRGTRVM